MQYGIAQVLPVAVVDGAEHGIRIVATVKLSAQIHIQHAVPVPAGAGSAKERFAPLHAGLQPVHIPPAEIGVPRVAAFAAQCLFRFRSNGAHLPVYAVAVDSEQRPVGQPRIHNLVKEDKQAFPGQALVFPVQIRQSVQRFKGIIVGADHGGKGQPTQAEDPFTPFRVGEHVDAAHGLRIRPVPADGIVHAAGAQIPRQFVRQQRPIGNHRKTDVWFFVQRFDDLPHFTLVHERFAAIEMH